MDNAKTLWQKFFHATKLYFPVRTQVNMREKNKNKQHHNSLSLVCIILVVHSTAPQCIISVSQIHLRRILTDFQASYS